MSENRNKKHHIWEKPDEETARERELIRKFDKEMLSYQRYGLPEEWGKKFWGFFMVLMTICCYNLLTDEDPGYLVGLMLVWFVFSPEMYLMRYIRLEENHKKVSWYQKMQYLPVDIKQVKIVRIGYLWDFMKMPLAILLVIQAGITLLNNPQLIGYRLLGILVIGWLIPFAVSACSVWYVWK